MFPAEKKGEFEPYKVRERREEVPVKDDNGKTPGEDVEMKDAPREEDGEQTPKAAATDNDEPKRQEMVEEVVYEEDATSDEGAVYPIRNGRIVDWPCFFALLLHIRNSLSPPLHTPVIIIKEPVWTVRDSEDITQFVFEKFKTPAFLLMDSALAACYGYGTATATVIDVGLGKVDVTAVTDFLVSEYGRGVSVEGCGGDAMTDRLLELLGPQGFSRNMCEQLKRSSITEILPAGVPLPASEPARRGPAASSKDQPAALASTGATDGDAPTTDVPRGPGDNTQTGDGDEDGGVLNVAEIVTGNTNEILAKREGEKAEKAAAKRGAVAEAAAQKQARLPNSKRETSTFQYEEYVPVEPDSSEAKNGDAGSKSFVLRKRDIEVGVERFLAATPKEHPGDRISNGILDDIAAQVYHTIHSVPERAKQNELWDSLIIVGNGSKVKGEQLPANCARLAYSPSSNRNVIGFNQALLHTIIHKYILSPTSTVFSSDMPPMPPTGAPVPVYPGQSGPVSSPYNYPGALFPHHYTPQPMLRPMATTITPTTLSYTLSAGHHQTPTSVKLLKPPEYFPEWKENANSTTGIGQASASSTGAHYGMEEAVFLGAQVAAKVIFVLDQGLSKGFMSRVEYNEHGPSAISDYLA